MKKKREEKVARREKWSKRKRLPKRDRVNSEIYNLLIKENEGPTYIATRTRIAICLLTVTGIQIVYIPQLWKDTKDIEFVRQTIGHRSLSPTSGYISEMRVTRSVKIEFLVLEKSLKRSSKVALN